MSASKGIQRHARGQGTTYLITSTGKYAASIPIDRPGGGRKRLTQAGFDTEAEAEAARVKMVNGIGQGLTTTTGRPSAKTMGNGAMLYDSDLSRPIWSDGVVWRGADGVET